MLFLYREDVSLVQDAETRGALLVCWVKHNPLLAVQKHQQHVLARAQKRGRTLFIFHESPPSMEISSGMLDVCSVRCSRTTPASSYLAMSSFHVL